MIVTCPWTDHLRTLSLSFLTCKKGGTILHRAEKRMKCDKACRELGALLSRSAAGAWWHSSCCDRCHRAIPPGLMPSEVLKWSPERNVSLVEEEMLFPIIPLSSYLAPGPWCSKKGSGLFESTQRLSEHHVPSTQDIALEDSSLLLEESNSCNFLLPPAAGSSCLD